MISRVMSPTNWPLLYHTVSNLQTEQLVGMLDRELRQLLVPHLPVDFDARYEAHIPETLPVSSEAIQQNTARLRGCLAATTRDEYRRRAKQLPDGTLSFHNESIAFDDITEVFRSDERISSYSPLWRLQLNAFTPVQWLVLGFDSPSACPSEVLDTIRSFITSWDTHHDIGHQKYLRRGWLPHAVSLRILILCRFCAWQDGDSESDSKRLRRFIYKNAAFLANHVEYDIDGNHLIENAAALLMASQFFDTAGENWDQLSRDIFDRTAEEQFLDDGGHFERSPMYHILVLQRYLTATDLLSVADTADDSIRKTAAAATGYLRALTPPDRRIPLLNDATFDEFLSLGVTLAYADAVGIAPTHEPESMDDSGYYWVGNGESRMLLDGGPVGPPHLPGHSHNDMLSFLLWIDGQRVVTDTGTDHYASYDNRQYVRSVRAHNTVSLGDHEPIDIGGQYLMGRRTSPEVRYSRGQAIDVFAGSYTKRSGRGIVYRHDRTVQSNGQWWCVLDAIDSTEIQRFRSRLHLSPTVSLSRTKDHITVEEDEETIVGIHPINSTNVTQLQRPYFPRFGESLERSTLEFEYTQESNFTGFVITQQSYETVNISEGLQSPVLTIGSERNPLRSINSGSIV